MTNAAGGSSTPRDEFLSDASTDASTGFDMAKFYVASTNKKGFATTLRLNVPPSTTAMMAQIVASKETPFRTPQDGWRDAQVIGLHYRAEWLGSESYAQLAEVFRQDAEIETMLVMAQRERARLEDYEKMMRLADTEAVQEEVKSLIRRYVPHVRSLDVKVKLERMLVG